MAECLPELIELGVDSFKIEGRMRSVYYIATVVNVYRKLIDKYCNDKEHYEYNSEYKRILDNCSNRDSIVQFFNGKNDHTFGYYNGRQEISNQDFLGIVLDYNMETHEVLLEQRNYYKKGDLVEFFGPNIESFTYQIGDIVDENGENIEIVRHPKQHVKLIVDKTLTKDCMMRIKR